MGTKQETIYLTNDQATDLVQRIAVRANIFDYEMSKPEMEAMADLLSAIGVSVDDLLDVGNLADNYAFNAEIVKGDKEAEQYSQSTLNDALFTWKEDGETCYCLNW